MTAQAMPQTVTQSTAPVSSSSSSVNIELAIPSYNANLSAIAGVAARQVFALGDSENGNLIADVVNHPATGAESALVTTLAPGSPDLRTIQELLSLILLEMRQLNSNLGFPLDSSYN